MGLFLGDFEYKDITYLAKESGYSNIYYTLKTPRYILLKDFFGDNKIKWIEIDVKNKTFNEIKNSGPKWVYIAASILFLIPAECVRYMVESCTQFYARSQTSSFKEAFAFTDHKTKETYKSIIAAPQWKAKIQMPTNGALNVVGIGKIPQDIFLQILVYASVENLKEIKLTCKQFYLLTHNERFLGLASEGLNPVLKHDQLMRYLNRVRPLSLKTSARLKEIFEDPNQYLALNARYLSEMQSKFSSHQDQEDLRTLRFIPVEEFHKSKTPIGRFITSMGYNAIYFKVTKINSRDSSGKVDVYWLLLAYSFHHNRYEGYVAQEFQQGINYLSFNFRIAIEEKEKFKDLVSNLLQNKPSQELTLVGGDMPPFKLQLCK